jgi:hypothetical protein
MSYVGKAAMARHRTLPEFRQSRELPSVLALHEIGHAVAAASFGLSIKTVALYPPPEQPTWAGYTQHQRGNAWAAMIVDLAGAAAELHFTGTAPDGETSDSVSALAMASALADNVRDLNEVEEILRQGRACASDLVRANAAAIVRLAHELDARRELSGAECTRILPPLSPGPTREQFRAEEQRREERIRYFVEKRLAEQERQRAGHLDRVPPGVRVDGMLVRQLAEPRYVPPGVRVDGTLMARRR